MRRFASLGALFEYFVNEVKSFLNTAFLLKSLCCSLIFSFELAGACFVNHEAHYGGEYFRIVAKLIQFKIK